MKGENVRTRILWIFAALFLVCSTPQVMAQEEEVGPYIEVEARYWLAELSSEISSDLFRPLTAYLSAFTDAAIKDDIDMVADAGLEDDKEMVEVMLSILFSPGHTLRLSFFAFETDGTKNNFLNMGQLAGLDVNVASELEMNVFEIRYEWDYFRRDWGELGAIFELNSVDFQQSVGMINTAIKAELDERIPVPLLGLNAEFFPFDFGYALIDVTGFSIGSVSIVDVEAGLGLTLFDRMTMKAGYRLVDFRADNVPTTLDYDTDLNIRLSGPIFSFSFIF